MALLSEEAEERINKLTAIIDSLRDEVHQLRNQLNLVEEENKVFRRTLSLYADVSSYRKIAFLRNGGAGWFAEDFSTDYSEDSRATPLPGTEARAVLGHNGGYNGKD